MVGAAGAVLVGVALVVTVASAAVPANAGAAPRPALGRWTVPLQGERYVYAASSILVSVFNVLQLANTTAPAPSGLPAPAPSGPPAPAAAVWPQATKKERARWMDWKHGWTGQNGNIVQARHFCSLF